MKTLFTEYNRLAEKLKKYLSNEAFAHSSMDVSEAKWRGIYREDVLMARTKIQKTQINEELNLEKPFPSNPVRHAKHIIRISRRGDLKGMAPFSATYAAAKFVDTAIGDEKYTWRTKDSILLFESGYELSCDELEDLVEYKYKGKEKEWELPDPYLGWAHEISTGVKSKFKLPEPEETPVQERVRKSQVSRSPKPSGLVSLAKICEELGVEPREARGILRKRIKKTENGWNFTPDEVENIKKLLKKR